MDANKFSKTEILKTIKEFKNLFFNGRKTTMKHWENNKGVNVILYDNDGNEYLLECPTNHINIDNIDTDLNRFNLYSLKSQGKGRFSGYLSFTISQGNARLYRLQLYNKESLGKGVGSQMLRYFEHFAFANGAKTASGTLAQKDENGEYHSLDEKLISKDNLTKFYQNHGFEIFYDGKKDEYAFRKQLDPQQIKAFAKRQISVSVGNTNFKVILPPQVEKQFNSIIAER